MKRILIINGPNLNMLGIREPEIYGTDTYDDLCAYISVCCVSVGSEYKIFQSNHEGAIVDEIQNAYKKYNGIVINAAAYTHTSIAIYDALKAVGLPAAEVHLSDISKREPFRRNSVIAAACAGTFSGKHFVSYKEAIEFISSLSA